MERARTGRPGRGPGREQGRGWVPRGGWRRPLALLAAAVAVAAAPRPAPAQGAQGPAGEEAVRRELTLEEALGIAREENTGLRVAATRTEAARAGVTGATSALLPHVELETGWLRTVDPVATFGTKLRQGVFGQEDFALDALNDPDAVTDWSTGAAVRWTLASPASWAERAAARHRADAAEWGELRTREATDLRTRSLYVRALQAGGRVRAAEAAEKAARATLERFRRREEEGMLTRADVLQARAELEAAAADLSDAERSRYEARVRLGLHLGWGPDTLPVPTDVLELPEPPAEEGFDPTARPDVRARAAGLEAAEAAATRADLAWAPRLDAFGAWSMHGGDLFSDQGTDWTVGVGLRWSLFTGLRRPAEARRASAEATAARLEYRQALREARGEVETARRAVVAARRAVEASRAARAAAREGRELMRRRFEEGLATPADLLQAEARATAMEVRAVDALAAYHVAAARLRFARSGTAGAGARP